LSWWFEWVNWLEAHESSLRLWIFVAVCAYFAYAVYFAVYGLNFSISLVYDQYVYGLVSKNPWWWAVLYYGSEGIAGSVAIVLRAIAAPSQFTRLSSIGGRRTMLFRS